MPRGIPNAGAHWTQLTNKAALMARRKEFLADIDARIKGAERREKALVEVKKWLAARKLGYTDLGWMYRQMASPRAAQPVKSKKPLQPPPKGNLLRKSDGLDAGFIQDGKHHPPQCDRAFRHAIYKARSEKRLSAKQVGDKLGFSGSGVTAWEKGRYVPSEERRKKLVKFLGLPADLGAAASQAMEAEHPGRPKGNSAASE